MRPTTSFACLCPLIFCFTLILITLEKTNEMRGHMLEMELNSLDPRNFDNIQDLFMNFKSLLLHLKGCGIEKLTQHNYLLISILEKLGVDYVLFISSFHTNRFTSRTT
jgi:hypothetical protein